MKIMPIINSVKTDIASSGIRIKNASAEAFRIGTRTARIYNQGNLRKYINITKCTSSKVIKGTRKEEIPYLAGAIGMFLPLPLTSPIMLVLGFIARYSLPDCIFSDKKERTAKNNLNQNV